MFGRQKNKTSASQLKALKDLTKILPVSVLLAETKRQSLLEKMKASMALDESRYDSLCLILVHNLVNYYQSLPETSNNYYSQPGGLLDHALNRTEAALSLFRQFALPDATSSLSEQQTLWQYALYSAALLKGIGKLFVDFRVDLYDAAGQVLKSWNPLLESLAGIGNYYDYSFEKETELSFRHRLNLLFARNLLPTSGFAWIASNPEVLAVWLALINEDERSAGTLGALLVRADAIAIQRYFNQFGAKSAAGRGGRFGRIGAFTDTTPESLSQKEQQIGIEFIQWLQDALATGRIQLNKSPLFMVPGGMLIGAEAFKWFMREHPDYKNTQAIENAFLSLGLHEAGRDGQVMTRFEQSNTQHIHSGILCRDFAVILPEQMDVQMNSGKVKGMSALEVIQSTDFGNQLVRTQISAPPAAAVVQLNASGQWSSPDAGGPASQPGAKGRG